MESDDTNTLFTASAFIGNYARAEEAWNQFLARPHARAIPPFELTVPGWLQFLQGKYAGAETALRETCPQVQGALYRPNCESMLGATLAAQKKFDEAEPLLLRSYDALGSQTPGLGCFLTDVDFLFDQTPGERILKLYTDWGKPEKVAEWKQKVQAVTAVPSAAKP